MISLSHMCRPVSISMLLATGDDNLLGELWRTRPRLHVFAHVRAGYCRELLVCDRLQMLYERICRGSGGLVAGLRAAFDSMEMFALFIRFMVRLRAESGTVLVNAAIVGRLKDTERREADGCIFLSFVLDTLVLSGD